MLQSKHNRDVFVRDVSLVITRIVLVPEFKTHSNDLRLILVVICCF